MKTKLPKTWQKVKLEDVVEFVDGDRGVNYPKNNELRNNGYCLFLNTKNIPGKEFYFSKTDNQFVAKEIDERLRKGKLKRGDFILTTRGTVGNFAYYSEKIPYESIRINSGMVILRSNSTSLDPSYFRQYLNSNDFRSQVVALSSGSAQPQLPIRDLSQFVITLPPLFDQVKIASILSAFDDKIEVNNKIAKTLEDMAKTIYKEWFVKLTNLEKLIVKNVAIKNIAYVKTGNRPGKLTGKKDNLFTIPVYGAKGIMGYTNKTLYNQKIVITGRVGTIGEVSIINDPSWPSDNVLILIPKDYNYFYFIYFLAKRINYLSLNRGSSQPLIAQSDIENYEINLPDKNLIIKFNLIVSKLFLLKENKEKENQKLMVMRDLLLPKLMKGELR